MQPKNCYGISIILFLVFVSALNLSAETVTFGSGAGGNNGFPFGIKSDGTNIYVGEYQQIYASSGFAQSFEISSIAFKSNAWLASTVTYDLTLGLGTTSRTTSGSYNTYANTFTQVFSGPLVTTFTPSSSDFDLVISLAAPFIYHPADGNLLLDVNISSASGTADTVFFSYESASANMGRVFNYDATGAPTNGGSAGLATQFTGNAVPEPSTYALLSLAAVVSLMAHRRRMAQVSLARIKR